MLSVGDFVNLTPHAITIKNLDAPGSTVTIPPHPQGAVRIGSDKSIEVLKYVAGFPIYSKPDMCQLLGNVNTFCEAKAVIVSTMVAEYEWVQKMRKNIFAPSTMPDHTVRNEYGQIIGILGLHQYS